MSLNLNPMTFRTLCRFYFVILITLLFSSFSLRAYALINILAAENIYGEVAKELGGNYVNVVSILNSPTQDPHLFNTTPSMLKMAYLANIVIYNGADYDPWMAKVLELEGQKDRSIINVSELIKLKQGENPHIWYLPDTVLIFAKHLASVLIKIDPEHQVFYQNQLNKFNQSYQIIFAMIKHLRERFQHTPVIATEPIFGYMAKSIGLTMHGEAFQINMMNDLPPSVSEIKAFEDDLYHHNIHLLIYNNQVISPVTERMRNIAKDEQIPVLGVSELLPNDTTYIKWMMHTLTELETQLQHALDVKQKAYNEHA